MNAIGGSQFIYFHPSGLRYLFYKEDNHLFFKILDGEKNLSDTQIADNIIEYAVTIDRSGELHLVTLSHIGELRYWKNKNNRWPNRLLITYDPRYFLFKNIKIYVIEQKIHILIAIGNIVKPELWSIRHHYWNGYNWFDKKVCNTYASKYDTPFHIDMDRDHNIHIAFRNLINKKSEIHYVRYHFSRNVWRTPYRISDLSQDCSHPFIFCDSTNAVHILWSNFNNNNFAIFHTCNHNIVSSKSQWSKIHPLSKDGLNSTHSYMIQVGDALKVIWKQNGKFYIVDTDISEYQWSKPLKIDLADDVKYLPTAIIGSTYKHFNSIKIPIGYSAIIKNDLYLLGIDEFSNLQSEIINTSYEGFRGSYESSAVEENPHDIDLSTINTFDSQKPLQEEFQPSPNSYLSSSLNQQNECSSQNLIYTDINQNISSHSSKQNISLADQLLFSQHAIEKIQNDQEHIFQLLNEIDSKQSESDHKVKEIHQLFDHLVEVLKKEKSSPFKKLFVFFNDSRKVKED